MADPRPNRFPDTDDDSAVDPDRGLTGGTPRWVPMIVIVIAVLVVVLLVVLHLTGAIGPGLHQ